MLERSYPPEGLSQPRPVAVMVGQLEQGGTERQLYLFLAYCDRSRWAPVVYVAGHLGHWETAIRKLGIRLVVLHGSRLAKMRQFRLACIAQRANCFFSWSAWTNCFGLALMGRGVHCIGSYRNVLFDDLRPRWRWLSAWLSFVSLSTIVCNSHETKSQAAGRVGVGRRVLFVPNAIQIFAPRQVQAWRAQWRARLGLADDAVLVLGVGRLVPQKNFGRFIDVIARVNRQQPVWGLIAGPDHGCLAELQGQVTRLELQDIVHFIGEVPDARELMCAADIYLLSSDGEGMPNVVLEAMAAGVPCVATRVNGVGDLIKHGSTGFLAAHNVHDLAQHVARLAADESLRREVGARARTTVEQKYQPEQIVPQLWALCDLDT